MLSLALASSAAFAGCAAEDGDSVEADVIVHDSKTDTLIGRKLTMNFVGNFKLTDGSFTASSYIHNVTENSYTVDGTLVELGTLSKDTDVVIEDVNWGSDMMFMLLYKDRSTRDAWAPAYINTTTSRTALFSNVQLKARTRKLAGQGYESYETYSDAALPGGTDAQYAVFAVPVYDWWDAEGERPEGKIIISHPSATPATTDGDSYWGF